MKGEDAKPVSKQSISDQFLKHKEKKPWHSRRQFMKLWQLTEREHQLTFFTVCRLCFSLILLRIFCKETSSKALKTWKTKRHVILTPTHSELIEKKHFHGLKFNIQCVLNLNSGSKIMFVDAASHCSYYSKIWHLYENMIWNVPVSIFACIYVNVNQR